MQLQIKQGGIANKLMILNVRFGALSPQTVPASLLKRSTFVGFFRFTGQLLLPL